MVEVSINLLYDEMKKMHQELHEIRNILVPEEKLDGVERQEFHATLAEIRQGKEKKLALNSIRR